MRCTPESPMWRTASNVLPNDIATSSEGVGANSSGTRSIPPSIGPRLARTFGFEALD
jgi:hypothetical protein